MSLFKDGSTVLKYTYMPGQVRALAAPAVLLIMVSEGVFRGHANTRAPAVAALSAAGANIILDPIFMFALSMGVAGAAGATAAAQYLAVAIYGAMLWRGARTAGGEGKRMAVPFFARGGRRRGAAAPGGDEGLVAVVRGVGGAVERKPARSAWALLATVISANAAMLLRWTFGVAGNVMMVLAREACGGDIRGASCCGVWRNWKGCVRCPLRFASSP